MTNPLREAMARSRFFDNGDTDRATGRTTSIALKAILDSIRLPGVPIPLIDHVDSPITNKHLADMVRDLIECVEFRYIRVSSRGEKFYVTFEYKTNGR